MKSRWRAGAIAWLASALLLPVQFVVAWQWPDGYSLSDNAISDLGVTTCGPFSDGGRRAREVCSPWYPLFNAGVVGSGALTALGAALLHGRWPGAVGRVGTIAMVIAGGCVMIVGFAPWDLLPDLHDGAALAQALVQWVAMIFLAVASGAGWFRWATIAMVAVSVTGFVVFLAALDAAELPWLAFGISERLSFDTLTIWTTLAGLAVLAIVRSVCLSLQRPSSSRSIASVHEGQVWARGLLRGRSIVSA